MALTRQNVDFFEGLNLTVGIRSPLRIPGWTASGVCSEIERIKRGRRRQVGVGIGIVSLPFYDRWTLDL